MAFKASERVTALTLLALSSGAGAADIRFHARKVEGQGVVAQDLRLNISGSNHRFSAEASVATLDYAEPSGARAAEKLSAEARLDWREHRAVLSVKTGGGQVYLEPVFADFAALPLQAQATVQSSADGWALESSQLSLGTAGTLAARGRLDAALHPQRLSATLDARQLAPWVVTAVQPFLIGGPLEGLTVDGSAKASLDWRENAPQTLSLALNGASLKAEKLGLSLDGLDGDLRWAQSSAAGSWLSWSGGALRAIPFGGATLRWRAQDRDLELREAWRQPLLDGALVVEQLALRGLGRGGLDASFAGEVQTLNLAALCRALGWPQFEGTLSGRLPGLSVRDDVWTLDGALEAQAFDGSLRIENLRAMQPLGVLPRVSADIEWRRLDLERLTRTFAFGRITGRLDGEVKNLRLLNWQPVAMDLRLYSTPDDDSPRRISQRAVDTLSAIGGGPTGLLSRGVMRFFEDFGYERIGLSCMLRDGICAMGGAETEGGDSYHLVKGAWLPRIDVVGYAQRVSWTSLLAQLKSAIASGGPSLSAPK